MTGTLLASPPVSPPPSSCSPSPTPPKGHSTPTQQPGASFKPQPVSGSLPEFPPVPQKNPQSLQGHLRFKLLREGSPHGLVALVPCDPPWGTPSGSSLLPVSTRGYPPPESHPIVWTLHPGSRIRIQHSREPGQKGQKGRLELAGERVCEQRHPGPLLSAYHAPAPRERSTCMSPLSNPLGHTGRSLTLWGGHKG